MKDLKLNYAPSRILDKREVNWEGKLVDDWSTLYASHESDAELIEKIYAVLDWFGTITCPGCGVPPHKMCKYDCKIANAIRDIDTWRGGK